MKKYQLTEEKIATFGKTLFRIKALINFSDVKEGELGGFVENEDNLSHLKNCWIYDDAKIFGYAKIDGNARISGNTRISGNAEIGGNAIIYDDVKISGYAKIGGYAEIAGNANIYGNAEIGGNATICGDAKIGGDAKISGYAEIYGDVIIRGDAEISGNADYIVFKNWWSSGRYFTWTKSNNMWSVGCFYGNSEELIDKAYNDSELCGKEYEKIVNYVNEIIENSEI